MGVTITSTGTSSVAATLPWTPTTLATHILGEINQDRNATGGTVPNRLLLLVHLAYMEVQEAYAWVHRTRTPTTISPGEATVGPLPATTQLSDTGTPTWPMTFNAGWHMLALAKAQEAFGRSDWQNTLAAYEAWLKHTKAENDRSQWLTYLTASPTSSLTPGGLAKQMAIEVLSSRQEGQLATIDPQLLLADTTNIAQQCYLDLWTIRDWTWRRGVATLAASAEYTDLAADFGKIAQIRSYEASTNPVLKYVDDLTQFQDWVYQTRSSTGAPQVAMVVPTTSITPGAVPWQLRVAPVPDKAYSYTYYYLKGPASYSVTTAPTWPSEFHLGFRLLCGTRVQQVYGRVTMAQQLTTEWEKWLARAIEQDEQNTASLGPVRDENRYTMSLPSSVWGNWQ